MTHLGLFEGIGGFSLAARWMGWETKAWCEWNEFGQKVLRHHFPEAEGFGDITKTDFTPYANRIDIITGGFPCQPYSLAGKRKGKEDERHLWPEMLRTIREVRPRWVVGENVFGLVNWSGGLVFHEVQSDLEAEGYEVFPYVLPACAVNAPHRRDRVWFVARKTDVADAEGLRIHRTEELENYQRQGGERRGCNINNLGEISDKNRDTVNPYANHKGLERRSAAGNAGSCGTERSEQPERFFNGTDWRNFPTESPVCAGNDGISAGLDGISFSKWRIESVKAGGNAIVPQVAYQIFKAIEQYENL